MARGFNLFGQAVALMEMTPRQIGAFHADQAIEDFAERRAWEAKEGLTPMTHPQDQEYLNGKAERFEKWAETARKQQERKA